MDRSDVEAWVKLGITDRRLSKFAAAEASCRKAVNLQPKLALGHYALGAALQCLGRIDDALTSYRTAIELNPALADAHYLLGTALHETGLMADAAASYRRAIELRPNYPEALSDLGAALVALGRMHEAEPVLQNALRLLPENPEAITNLGTVREQAGRADEALSQYRRALRLSPGKIRIVTKLAALLERQGRLPEARSAIGELASEAAEDPEVILIQARIARSEGRLQDAIDLLKRASEAPTDHALAGEIDLLRAQLYDRLNDPKEAFAHILTGNRHVAIAMAVDRTMPPTYLRQVAVARSYLTDDLVRASSHGSLTAAAPLVFLVGFPRSGTTLLEQILDSHPALQTLDEKPAVGAMRQAFLAMASNRSAALADLDTVQILHLRDIYFAEVDGHLRRHPGTILVDKLPLNIVWVHLIWRVFPDAKFLLAMRHPCDACLSCLMQNFAMNEAMTSFLTMDHAIQTYTAVMGLWQEQVRMVPIRPHRLRYEDLVADFEPETRRLLDFIGVGWDDSIRAHVEHARKRGQISTPSYHQVTQPIYQHAAYRWQRYADRFAPFVDTLRPFIDTFGYAD